MNPFRATVIILSFCITGLLHADDDLVVKYLANEGVLISHGETKIVFDPLFDEDYGTYELVPEDLERALFTGAPPFDGLDAAFVSHHHDDHFSPERMVALLQARPNLQLFAPRQAIASMPVDSTDSDLRGRLHTVAPGQEGKFTMVVDDIEVSAVRIPHAGWPTRNAEVENIVFKVSLNKAGTVLHMGDAHTDPTFFDQKADYWAERHMHLALPPYWFFLSVGGKKILEDHIHADETFGVHVPAGIPDSPAQYPEELRGWTLLSVPGEEKRIAVDVDAQ